MIALNKKRNELNIKRIQNDKTRIQNDKRRIQNYIKRIQNGVKGISSAELKSKSRLYLKMLSTRDSLLMIVFRF